MTTRSVLLVKIAGIAAIVVSSFSLTLSLADTRQRPLFIRIGCSNCHGTVGQGSIAGPKLAPAPIPWEAFRHLVRHPSAEMPPYSEAAISDEQLKEMYEYLESS
jgi:hypothetical protein